MRLILALLVTLATAPSARADTLLAESFEAAQWALQSSAGAAMAQRAARQGAGLGADVLRQRQITADVRARLEAELAALPQDDTQSANALSGRIDVLEIELEALDARLAALGAGGTASAPLTLEDTQALLAPGEGLVLFYVGDEDTFIWAITPQNAAWRRISTGRSELADGVAAIRASLIQANTVRAGARLNTTIGPRGPAFERQMAALLYAELLAPFEPILANVAHLFTVADGPLTALPFSLLITTPGQALTGADNDPEALRQTQWFFQRHALTTLPSVEALRALRTGGRVAHDGPLSFLGFGDPTLDGALANPTEVAAFRTGPEGLEDIRALAPLPGTRRELRRLARTLNAGPDRVWLGDAATEPAVRAAPLASADVIAFATHGLLSGDLRGLGEPALVLTPPATVTPGNDGLLTASEIAALDIPAEWVILSACNTAGGDGRPDAEGLSGLARAFLFAGARSLIVSHWPVRDDAAARLTTDMFADLASGHAASRAAALQGAMQAMLMDGRDDTLAHPAAWAPFVLVGEGAL